MTDLRILLGYFHPWPNDVGFYVARAAGEFAARGLDARIGVVDPGRGDTIAHLHRGEAELGVAPSNRLLAARGRGERLVAVAAINQVGLESVHSLRSLGVERLRDLSGRRVALNPTPRGLAMVRHLIAADGGDPTFVPVHSGTRELQSADLAAGVADAYFGAYWAWDELLDPYAGPDRLSWPVKDNGAPPFHSYVLVAREDWAREHPEALGRALAAAEAGFRAAAADPAGATATFENAVPYFPRRVLERSLDLVAPTWFHDGRWGVLRPELIEPYAHWLHENGALADLSGLAGATLDDAALPGSPLGATGDTASAGPNAPASGDRSSAGPGQPTSGREVPEAAAR